MITWRHDTNNQLLTDSHNDLEKIMRRGGKPRKMRRGGRTRKKYNAGGYLRGPSHERGGIPAKIQNGGMVELEGGEYIINAQTVDAVGTQFLDELNSTQTSYHTGGFGAGQLPSPSQYKRGGKIRRNKMRRGGRPKRRMQYGGVSPTGHNTMQFGTATTTCPEGMHMMPDGTCMEGAYHGASPGQYRKGGRPTRRMRRGGRPTRRMQSGGRPTRRMQSGGGVGSCPSGNYGVDQYGNNVCL